MSLLMGLESALRSLRTHTIALNTTQHNIANMNNPSYSRQLSIIGATQAIDNISGGGQLGTGSYISSISRIRDTYLDRQIRAEWENVGKWDAKALTYQSLRAVFPEIDGVTANQLGAQLANFYKGWADLSAAAKAGSPGGINTAQIALYNSAETVAKMLNKKAFQLVNLQLDVTAEIQNTVKAINQHILEISVLNRQITQTLGRGQSPNDLLDKRNEVINKLSALINIHIGERTDGSLVVHVNGHVLVNGNDGYNKMTTMAGAKDSKLEDVGLYEYSGAVKPVRINDAIHKGKIAGLLEMRDQVIHGYKVELDNLANSMISTVNKFHNAAAAGMNFFQGNKASTISINKGLLGGTNIGHSKYQAGDMADVLANLESKMMGNFITSRQKPGLTSATLLGTSGILRVGDIDIPFSAAQTVGTLIQNINYYSDRFSAVFDDVNNTFFMVTNAPIRIQELDISGSPKVAGGVVVAPLLNLLELRNERTSLSPVNYSESTGEDMLRSSAVGHTWDAQVKNLDLKILTDEGTVIIEYNNVQHEVNWRKSDPIVLNIIRMFQMNGAPLPNMTVGTFDEVGQKFRFATGNNSGAGINVIAPFSIVDKIGNLADVMKINSNVRFGEVYDSVLKSVENEINTSENILAEYGASLNQLVKLQDSITKVDENEELARAKAYQRAYDASVRLLGVIDEMMNMLINRTATPSSSWE